MWSLIGDVCKSGLFLLCSSFTLHRRQWVTSQVSTPSVFVTRQLAAELTSARNNLSVISMNRWNIVAFHSVLYTFSFSCSQRWRAPSRRAQPCRSASCASGAASRSNWTLPSMCSIGSQSRSLLVCGVIPTAVSQRCSVSICHDLTLVYLSPPPPPPQLRWSQWHPANRLTALRGRQHQR